MASIPKASTSSSKSSSKFQKTKYTLDCTTPANDNIVNTSGLVSVAIYLGKVFA